MRMLQKFISKRSCICCFASSWEMKSEDWIGLILEWVNLAKMELQTPNTPQIAPRNLTDGHAFRLQLCYPSLHARFGLVGLVVSIERKPKKLAILHTLGF